MSNRVEVNLDDLTIYPKTDPAGMLARIKELPAQYRKAWQDAKSFSLPAGYRNVNKIVVLGMGGSAIGADLVKALLHDELKIPFLVHRDYGMPAYVDENTLLIASSFSGDTEETLSGLEPALKMGTKKLAITTGGKVGQLAEQYHFPAFKINYQAQPRAALGFSFIALLGIMQHLGFVEDKTADVADAVLFLEDMAPAFAEDSPAAINPAKQMALRLYGKLPVIFGAGITAEVAHRWAGQFNENAKTWGFYAALPELNHNVVVGFPHPDVLRANAHVILLRSPLVNQRVQKRFELTAELLKQSGVAYEYVDPAGSTPLAQMSGLISLGDYVSYYLAILNKVDPTPVASISHLKEQLAKS
jgi:glucose/mannose-6-phosphate isomerase